MHVKKKPINIKLLNFSIPTHCFSRFDCRLYPDYRNVLRLPSLAMIAFPVIPIILLLIGINAAPTALAPETTSFDATGQTVEEARAHIIKRHPCEVKASMAYNTWNDAHRKCDGWGLGSFFHGECWWDEPTNCCPEDRMSKTCKKFWPG
jgi:hypothetical protein